MASDRGSGVTLDRITDPLERLLLRCHRDEMLPLAALLRVREAGVGLGLLARNLARATRRLARHGLANAMFGRGDGPPWTEVLARMTGERLVGYDEVEEAELRIVRRVQAARWGALPLPEREALWTSLGLAGPPPDAGDDAMTEAQSQLGRAFGYVITQAHTGVFALSRLPLWLVLAWTPGLACILQPILMILALSTVAWTLRADAPRLESVVLHVARLRQVVLRRITIGFVGSPSTGKDAGIRALFGVDSGNISPVAGSTKTVNIQRVPGATALYVVNTPGLGDVVQAVTDEAKEVLAHIDVYLYVINAEGGVQARELADYRACVASGKPVLAMVNKIDLLRPRDRERYLLDAREKLKAADGDFLAVAFDPMPELSSYPIGMEEVRAWVESTLSRLGKDPAELPPLPVRPPTF